MKIADAFEKLQETCIIISWKTYISRFWGMFFESLFFASNFLKQLSVIQLIFHDIYQVSIQNKDSTKHYWRTIIYKVTAVHQLSRMNF